MGEKAVSASEIISEPVRDVLPRAPVVRLVSRRGYRQGAGAPGHELGGRGLDRRGRDVPSRAGWL